LQSHVEIYPGETALAFYTAKNPTEKPIDGIRSVEKKPL
jgi:cytochrome c oxidase assembly protein subunit 11